MRTPLRIFFPVSLAVFALLSTAVAAFSAYRWVVQRDVELATEALERRAVDLSASLETSLQLGDTVAVQRELDVYSNADWLQSMLLANQAGLVVAATRTADIGRPIAAVISELSLQGLLEPASAQGANSAAAALADGDPEGVRSVVDRRGKRLSVLQSVPFAPVMGAPGPGAAGTLVMISDLSQRRSETLSRVLMQSYLAAIPLLLLAGAYYYIGRRVLVTRVQRLVDAAGRVAQGDFSVRIRSDGSSELEQVCRAFDQMASKLVKVRQDLQANEARLSGILDTVASAIISVDPGQRILLFNRRAEQIFGYSATEVLGRSVEMLMPERFRGAHGAALRRFQGGNEEHRPAMQRPDIRGLRKNGQEFPIEASVSRVVINGQSILTVALDDITERRRAEQALQQIGAAVSAQVGEGFFRELVRNIATVFAADYAFVGRVGGGNYQQVTTLALWAQDRYGENFTYDLDATPCANVIGKRSCIYPSNVANEFPKDTLLATMGVEAYLGTPLFGAEGQPLGLLVVMSRKPFEAPAQLEVAMGIFAARTGAELERQTALESLARMASTLEQKVAERTANLTAVNRELEGFCYSVSHDLRAPLRAIDGFSQALLEDHATQLDDTGRDYLQRVRRATQRMDKLIVDLLGLSRVTRQELHQDVVDLSAMARDAVGRLRESDPTRNVNVSIAPDLLVRADRRLLAVVMENLLDNAWKYTNQKDDASVEVGSRAVDNLVVYYVKDNGVGFDMRYADTLFRPFQRLHRSEQFPGTGIGLATVARVIYRHGGIVWADGEPGHGATVYFTLDPPADGQLDALRVKAVAA